MPTYSLCFLLFVFYSFFIFPSISVAYYSLFWEHFYKTIYKYFRWSYKWTTKCHASSFFPPTLTSSNNEFLFISTSFEHFYFLCHSCTLSYFIQSFVLMCYTSFSLPLCDLFNLTTFPSIFVFEINYAVSSLSFSSIYIFPFYFSLSHSFSLFSLNSSWSFIFDHSVTYLLVSLSICFYSPLSILIYYIFYLFYFQFFSLIILLNFLSLFFSWLFMTPFLSPFIFLSFFIFPSSVIYSFSFSFLLTAVPYFAHSLFYYLN